MRNRALLCAIALPGCAPLLADDTPLVTDTRVLAIRADPPEAPPDAEVLFTALVADETGALSSADLAWAFCTLPRPLAELGPAALSCLEAGSPDLASFGQGISATGQVPLDTCSLFGPNPPPPREGEPSGRPADPDVTGGFYQPVTAFLDGAPTLTAVRTRCGIANVSQETYIAWNQGYLSNLNPTVLELLLDEQSVPRDGEGTPALVTAGEEVTLTVRWPDCPEPGECSGAETYLVYDPTDETLLPRREALSATWFSTGGTFAEARNGRAGDDERTEVTNRWTVPPSPGPVWLAIVLRDERGGVDFAGFRFDVAE